MIKTNCFQCLHMYIRCSSFDLFGTVVGFDRSIAVHLRLGCTVGHIFGLVRSRQFLPGGLDTPYLSGIVTNCAIA